VSRSEAPDGGGARRTQSSLEPRETHVPWRWKELCWELRARGLLETGQETGLGGQSARTQAC